MPSYDYKCQACAREFERWTTISLRNSQQCDCGSTDLERVFKPNNVIPDEIPGGILMENGLCYPDGTPRRFYSRSEIERAAGEKGLMNLVQHIPEKGSDKSKHTTRWY